MRINKKNLGKDKSMSFLLIFWDKENVFFLLILWDGGSTYFRISIKKLFTTKNSTRCRLKMIYYRTNS